MMKKDLLNKQVVRAISLGLSAVMLTTPMTALANEATDVEPVDVPEPEYSETEEKAFADETEAIDNAQEMTDIAADTADVEKVPALAGVEVDPDPETEGDEITYNDVKTTEEAANSELQDAEVAIIEAGAELEAAKVDVGEAETIINDINDNNQVIADANEEAIQAAADADSARIAAENATTEEAAIAAVEDAKKALNDAKAAQDTAQAAYDENLLKLQEAYNELEAARQNLADMQNKIDATAEEIAAAQALADKALADAQALEAAVAEEEAELAKLSESVLKAAYDAMLKEAELASRFDTYDDAPAYPDDDATGEFEDEFGVEGSSNGNYWDKARQYFFLYLKEWYAEQGLEIIETKWDRSNILDNGKKYDSEVDNTYTVTYKDKDGKIKTAYYNYHTQKAEGEIVKGDITIYEKVIGEETKTTKIDHGLSIKQEDADGNVTYIKYEDVKDEENDVVVNVKDADGNDTGSVLVKDANSVQTADVDELEKYMASLGEGQSVTNVSEETTTEYEIGDVTVVDSYEKKKEHNKSVTNFSGEKDFKNQVESAMAEGKTVEISWKGFFGTYKLSANDVNWFTHLLDKCAGDIESIIGDRGLKIDVYDMVDDISRPKETHTEQGIIVKTKADVTTTTVINDSQDGFEADGYWTLFGFKVTKSAYDKAKEAAEKEKERLEAAGYTNVKINVYGPGLFDEYDGAYYTISYESTETKNEVIQTQAFTATGYSKNTETVEEKIKIWKERADQSGDEFIKSKIADARQKEKEMLAKKEAAAAATAAAKAAKEAADAAWAELQEVEVGDAGYSEAVAKYDAAKEAFKDAEEDLEETKKAAQDAEDDYKDAVDELDRFAPEDDGDDNDNDDDDYTAPYVAPLTNPETPVTGEEVVTPVVAAGTGAGTGAAVVDIEDEETPLAAGIDNGNGDEDANGGDGDDVLVAEAEDDTAIVAIEDEETPLAAGSGADGKMSWWWLLIVALLGATGYKMYKDHQKKKEEAAQEA